MDAERAMVWPVAPGDVFVLLHNSDRLEGLGYQAGHKVKHLHRSCRID